MNRTGLQARNYYDKATQEHTEIKQTDALLLCNTAKSASREIGICFL
jgi:hypothetical protein